MGHKAGLTRYNTLHKCITYRELFNRLGLDILNGNYRVISLVAISLIYQIFDKNQTGKPRSYVFI